MKSQLLIVSLLTLFFSVNALATEVTTMLPTCNLITTHSIAKYFKDNKDFTLVYNSEYTEGSKKFIEESHPDTKEYYTRFLRYAHLYHLLEDGYVRHQTNSDKELIERSLILRKPYTISLIDTNSQAKTLSDNSVSNTQVLKAFYTLNFERAVTQNNTDYKFEPLYTKTFFITQEFTFQNLAKQFLKEPHAKDDSVLFARSSALKFIASGKPLSEALKQFQDNMAKGLFTDNVNYTREVLIEETLLRRHEINKDVLLEKFNAALPKCER